jgi:hypothetical protein
VAFSEHSASITETSTAVAAHSESITETSEAFLEMTFKDLII